MYLGVFAYVCVCLYAYGVRVCPSNNKKKTF